jgi:HK97 family phage portal protein
MGLGRLIRPGSDELRAVPSGGTRYDVYDTDNPTVLTQSFTVDYNLAPDWPASAYRNGMSIPGASRGALLIAGLLGSSPWHAFRKASGGDPAPRMIDPVPPLLEQPAPPDVAAVTWGSMALDFLWDGNAIGIYAARDRYGWPTAIVPVPAGQVFVRRVDERHYPLPYGEIEYMIGDLSFSPSDVLHIKGPSAPGDLRGRGVLENHMRALSSAELLSAEAHSPHGVPSGVLTSENPDLKKREARELKAAWMESQRTRTVAVLNATTKFEALAWNPEQAQLIEARKFSLSEWELIFGLPVGWLGGQTSSRTYSNIEQDAINLIKFTLSDHLTRWKQTLSQAFPRGVFVEPDLDALLASDTMSRYKAYAVALGNKSWLLPSEVRALERYVAVDGIDDAPTGQPAGAPSQPTTSTDDEIEEVVA